MTGLSNNVLIKFACISLFVLASKVVPSEIVSADDLLGVPPEKKAITSSAAPDLVGKDDRFERFIKELRTLKVNGNLDPWRQSVNRYLEKLDYEITGDSLDSLKQRILTREGFSGKREKKINSVFRELKSDEGNAGKDVSSPFLICLLLGDDDSCATKGSVGCKKKAIVPARSRTPTVIKADVQTEPVRGVHSPLAIMEHLKLHIAGQDDALLSISVLAHRFLCNKVRPTSRPQHCILTGPTGCGKSETLNQLCEFLGVPFLQINTRSLTDEGYKGTNFSEAVDAFCKQYHRPKFAIVALEEIDKLASSGGEEGKDFGQSVQRVLLSCLDGRPVIKESTTYDISNWWFVGTGAFSGISGVHDDEGAERTTTAITHEDIVAYGFEPEFVGRFAEIIQFKGHTLETMLEVVSKAGSPVDLAIKEFMAFYKINLSFEKAALRRLAEATIKVGLGVRSLHTVLNEILRPHYMKAGSGGMESELVIKEDEVKTVIEKQKADRRKAYRGIPGLYI